jgi:arylesterase/paraoxonase
MVTLLFKHFDHPDKEVSPSSALRLSINTGKDAAFGKKYNVDKMFEDDGKIASGVTSAVYDSQRKLLFMNGLASPHLAICKLNV